MLLLAGKVFGAELELELAAARSEFLSKVTMPPPTVLAADKQANNLIKTYLWGK